VSGCDQDNVVSPPVSRSLHIRKTRTMITKERFSNLRGCVETIVVPVLELMLLAAFLVVQMLLTWPLLLAVFLAGLFFFRGHTVVVLLRYCSWLLRYSEVQLPAATTNPPPLSTRAAKLGYDSPYSSEEPVISGVH
jgi:hypothetical protein